MVFPRSDGRFVSRGYGWATLLEPANPKKGMKAAIELDGLVIDEVSFGRGRSRGRGEEGGRREGEVVVSFEKRVFERELTVFYLFASSLCFLSNMIYT